MARYGALLVVIAILLLGCAEATPTPQIIYVTPAPPAATPTAVATLTPTPMPAVLGDAARLWCANHTVEVFVAATDLGVPQPYVKGDAMLSWLADSLNYGRNSQQAQHHPDVQDQWLSENEAGYVRVCTAAFESR